MELYLILFWLAVGIVFGIGSGVTGLSAVNLILPLLYAVFSFTILAAIGTSLFIDMINSGVVAFFYSRYGNVDFKVGILMGCISFFFAILGAHVAFLIAAASEETLAMSFGFFQILLGIVFIYRGFHAPESEETGKMEKNRLAALIDRLPDKYIKVIIIGAAIILGFFGGLLGAGGGFIITFILVFALSFESHKAVGTACLVMLFTTAGAVLYYGIQNSIDFGLGGMIAGFSIIGAILGTKAAHKLSEKHLTIALGGIIMAFGFVMIFY